VRGAGTNRTLGVFEFRRVKEFAAVLALIPTGVL